MALNFSSLFAQTIRCPSKDTAMTSKLAAATGQPTRATTCMIGTFLRRTSPFALAPQGRMMASKARLGCSASWSPIRAPRRLISTSESVIPPRAIHSSYPMLTADLEEEYLYLWQCGLHPAALAPNLMRPCTLSMFVCRLVVLHRPCGLTRPTHVGGHSKALSGIKIFTGIDTVRAQGRQLSSTTNTILFTSSQAF